MKKIVIPALLSLFLLFSFTTSTFAASVGKSITSPEDGWKRYDVSDKAIQYIGSGKFAINKYSNNKGPFTKRTDYVIFDKILTFEISEYTTN